MSGVVGIYGKLPSQGDFVSRDLPSHFLSLWDQWLQQGIVNSQQLLGEGWTELYLVAPVWRFVLSKGIIGDRAWGGILLPSVDRVGRYFPLTMVSPLPADVAPFAWMSLAKDWYGALQTAGVEALQMSYEVEQLQQIAMQRSQPLWSQLVQCSVIDDLLVSTSVRPGSPILSVMNAPTDSLWAPIAQMLQSEVERRAKSGNQYSLWWSEGSEQVKSNFSIFPYLPEPQQFTTLIDGNFNRW